MRIISGKHKGRRLKAPKSLPVRPTTDMAKEGLMNILAHQYDFEDSTILDLFSGTGNMSFEFFSRGIKACTAVDANHKCIRYISDTSKTLNFDLNIIKMDVFKFLTKSKDSYDIIFADPPYNFEKELLEKIYELVFENQLLSEKGVLIIEHAAQNELDTLEFFQKKRKYGSSVFSFFAN
jgi:16S rRNA (guanine(966)-N(2))-methyltransferase RsmD